MSKRASWLISGLVALVLAMVTFLAALSTIETGSDELTPTNGASARSMALTSHASSEAFTRGVALIDQSPAGYLAASAPIIGQSVFPGEALARSLALTSQPIGEAFVRSVALIDQSPAGYLVASAPIIGQSVFPGEALARSLALSTRSFSGISYQKPG